MNTRMKASAILRQAIKRMQGPGRLWKGQNGETGVGCTMTCVLDAAEELGDTRKYDMIGGQYIQKALATMTTLEAATPGWQVVSWNDKPQRTKDDVIALYERAIELAEAVGD